MSVAIETVIIVIVVVSFTVLGAIVFALYWLWRLLLEGRRCTRLNTSNHLDWNRRPNRLTTVLSSHSVPYSAEQAPLTSSRTLTFPRITRSSDVIVDERSQRMSRGKREQTPPLHRNENFLESTTDVIVLDDTEPPPPYEGI